MRTKVLCLIVLQFSVSQAFWLGTREKREHMEDASRSTGTSRSRESSCSEREGNAWYSNIIQREVQGTLAARRISWQPDPEVRSSDVPQYAVVIVKKNESGEFEIVESVPSVSSESEMLITDLAFDTVYIIFVCYSNSVTNLSLSNAHKEYKRGCGYCFTSFIIEQPRSETEELINATTMQTIATPSNMAQSEEEPTDSYHLPTSVPEFQQDQLPKYAIIILGMVLVAMIAAMIFTVGSILVYKKCRIRNRRENIEISPQMKTSQFSVKSFKGNTDSSVETSDVLAEKILKKNFPEEMFISPSDLNVTSEIGQGEFGIIYKAFVRTKDSTRQTAVAIKTLKGIFAPIYDIETVTKEILRMHQFDHPNVMSLIGVCMNPSEQGSASVGPSIVMPFMARGSLLEYLRKESKNLNVTNEDEALKVRKPLVQICYQIAKGMEYLASLKYVHRDLAARNCLIDANYVIKVSDFGLTESTYTRNYFRQAVGRTKLPLKWMAIESIKFGIFSEKTDVWSYGVTCWEVFSGGVIPYTGTHPREILAFLEGGGRLLKPTNAACFNKMNTLMQSCWRAKDSRPTFSGIVHVLETYLATVSDYTDLSELMVDREDEHKPTLSMSMSHGFINKIVGQTKSIHASQNDYTKSYYIAGY